MSRSEGEGKDGNAILAGAERDPGCLMYWVDAEGSWGEGRGMVSIA